MVDGCLRSVTCDRSRRPRPPFLSFLQMSVAHPSHVLTFCHEVFPSPISLMAALVGHVGDECC